MGKQVETENKKDKNRKKLEGTLRVHTSAIPQTIALCFSI